MSAHRRLIALSAGLLAGTASAAPPALDPVFASGAVIQRGRPVVLAGDAAPGEGVEASLAGRRGRAVADAQGRWQVTLPALAAGGPHRIDLRFAGGAQLSATDVLVGDVWLCSGQSNMEWPVRQALNPDGELTDATDPQLRLLSIAKQTALAPARGFAQAPQWAAAKADTVAPFSAACYFMGRDLRKSEGVPIGLINASWGGTAIRSWMDPASSARVAPADAAMMDLYRRDPAAANRQFGERWAAWWSAQQPTKPWLRPDALRWRPMPIGYWEQWGDPAFASFNGTVWVRSNVKLTRAEAAQGATLSLGVIDEIDQTWVNGVPVGNSFGWTDPRTYAIPPGVLREGANSIIVAVTDNYGAGGLQGPAEVLALRLAGGAVKPLAPGLQYSVSPRLNGEPPRSPWDPAAGLSLIYNGMVAPLGRVGLKGVAWYQGESDAGMAAGYDSRLRGMMAAWRAQFGDPALPFLIVGLPAWGPPHVAPVASGWAEVRDAQRRVGTGERNAALVPAIDIGDPLELHPPQKQAVGRRLALAARALATAPRTASGPHVAGARRDGGDIVVEFAGVRGELRGWSGPPTGFELCGAAQTSCRFARATASGRSVRVHGDGAPVTRVRYAWADAPVVNLHDDALPVSTFEVAVD